MDQSPQPKINVRGDALERAQLIKNTIQAFAELVMIQKLADIPGWIDIDLTVSQVRALYFLAARERLTISDLAKLLGMGKPAASILVQQLVEHQLAERSEDTVDRRRCWVRLAARGSELLIGRREMRESTFQGWLGQMKDDELSCLLKGITALLVVVQKSQA